MSKKTHKKGVTSLFILREVSIKDLLSKYYYPDISTEIYTSVDEKSTPILFLDDEQPTQSNIKDCSFSFLSPYKENVKYWVTMINSGDETPLPRLTTKPCFWCQESFNTAPIGCPIKYHFEKNEIEFPVEKKRFEEHLKNFNFPTDAGNDWFETKGIFCSFPCAKAYIFDSLTRTKTSKYSQSLTLLTLMVYEFYGKLMTIPTAAPREALERWSGHLSAEKHRKSFGVLEYVETGNLRRPLLYSSREYIQEKRVKPSNNII